MESRIQSRRWQSNLLFVFNLMGMIVLIGMAILLALSNILTRLFAPSAELVDPSGNFLMASALVLVALLLIPGTVQSLRRINNHFSPPHVIHPIRGWQIAALVTAWLVAVVLSNVFYLMFDFGWIISIPFYLASIALPVGGLLWVALGGLPLGSRQRNWGTFSIAMLGGPSLAGAVEVLFYLAFVMLMVFMLLMRPDWQAAANQLSEQLANAPSLDVILEIFSPIVLNPVVVLGLLAVLAGLVPLVEEAIKPLVVILLGKRLENPVDGFVLGAISGAGFAFVEGLLAASNTSEGWGVLLAARAAGSLMHITTSAIFGWGLVAARQQKRFLLLAGTYFSAVILHGLWNASAVILAIGSLRIVLSEMPSDLLGIVMIITGVAGMGLLTVAMLTVLPMVNHRLRPKPVGSEIDV